MVEAELPMNCTPLDPRKWQEIIYKKGRECSTAYLDTGNPDYQTRLDYLRKLKTVYGECPECCILYMNPSGELGLLRFETEKQVRDAIERRDALLTNYN